MQTAPPVTVTVADSDKKGDDDGSGNTNGLVPIYRKLVRNYAVGMIVMSIALLGALIAEAATLWNARPAWIKKVPCVLQPQLRGVEVRSRTPGASMCIH